MAQGKLVNLADRLRDAPIRAALWLLDRLLGPYPDTLADEIRERRRERLRKAFPGLFPEDRGSPAPVAGEDREPPVPGEWYLGVPCSRCGEMVLVFPDASRGEGSISFESRDVLRRRCVRGHLTTFRADELRRFQWWPAAPRF